MTYCFRALKTHFIVSLSLKYFIRTEEIKIPLHNHLKRHETSQSSDTHAFRFLAHYGQMIASMDSMRLCYCNFHRLFFRLSSASLLECGGRNGLHFPSRTSGCQ